MTAQLKGFKHMTMNRLMDRKITLIYLLLFSCTYYPFSCATWGKEVERRGGGEEGGGGLSLLLVSQSSSQ